MCCSLDLNLPLTTVRGIRGDSELSDNRERVFRAPGRVNLIGEHTDYNDGFVLPTAIDFSTWVRLTPLAEKRLEIFSENFDEQITIPLDDSNLTPHDHWSDYVVGVAVVLQQAGYSLRGAQLKIRGEVPIGSGLSSSAALEVATACALVANSNLNIDRVELAKICRRAENEFVGARVGIMGLTKCVRPPRPCRPSKLRLLVDAHRCPG